MTLGRQEGKPNYIYTIEDKPIIDKNNFHFALQKNLWRIFL